jgi:N-acetylmuramoyl-L-alanine amidase
MIVSRLSPNHGPRRATAPIDMLILHYTGMTDAASALDRLCDPASQVSAHYMVDENGGVWRLVPEDRRAWHAGIAFWAGETDINSRSIGIEIVNPGHGPDYRPFPEPQMLALERLCRDILGHHAIPPHRVLAHSDIAPARKRDPGELFDWRRLAAAGIGLWSNADGALPLPDADFAMLMRRFGYADASSAAIAAFQRHFRPDEVTGVADRQSEARLADLVRQADLVKQAGLA